jgi:hypothetical protein
MPSLEAGSPYDLRKGTFPTVRAEAGHVVLRLELASLRDQQDVHLVEIILEGRYAANLGFEMIEATKKLA